MTDITAPHNPTQQKMQLQGRLINRHPLVAPDIQARRHGHQGGDEDNDSRLDDAVFKIGMLGPELEIFFK
jgi:hypothetical protein